MSEERLPVQSSGNELVIFDFDGVLVDTEYTTFAFYKAILPRYGIQLNEKEFRYKIGRKSLDFFRDVLGDRFDPVLVEDLIQQKRHAFQEDIRTYLTPIRGGFALVRACREAGLLVALGSQNERPLIEAAVDTFGIRPYFHLIRSLQDLTHKKPHPEIFLTIAERLGVAPALSVVLEDALDGIQAAQAGGFKTIAVTTSHPAERFPGAHRIVETPAELTPEILRRL